MEQVLCLLLGLLALGAFRALEQRDAFFRHLRSWLEGIAELVQTLPH